mgnify:CR=1 FL=1
MPSFDSFTVEHLKETDVEELASERQKRFLVDVSLLASTDSLF